MAVATAAALAFSAQTASADPLGSAIWPDIVEAHLGAGEIVYDDAVKVTMPRVIWEPWSVPVQIKFSEELGPVSEVFLFAENNPIQTAAQILPRRAVRAVGMNIRLERTTPVRAAARSVDGVWHVANVEVTVIGAGGCSNPSVDVAEGDVGVVATKQFDQEDGGSRVKVMITHPMDTGLVDDANGDPIPAYYIDSISVADERGPIADLVTYAALAADPAFTFDLPDRRQSVRVTARDTLGLAFDSDPLM
jgi:sulfur-oxidizing protein SoxY